MTKTQAQQDGIGDGISHWDRFEQAQAQATESNRERLKGTLAKLGIVQVDVEYAHSYSNDEGHGHASPVSARLTDGSVVDVKSRHSISVTPEVQMLKDALIAIDAVWSKGPDRQKGETASTIEHKSREVDVLTAIRELEIVDDAFMCRHGSRHQERDSDDEGGTRCTDVTEGTARIDVASLKASPLDGLGNVIKADTGFGRHRW